jgi:tetratricopeptide (TPR) repeat protein
MYGGVKSMCAQSAAGMEEPMKQNQLRRSRSLRRTSLLAMCGLLAAGAHAQPNAKRNESVLQQRYDAAQKYQAAGDLAHAAEQYRIFIADALGEMATGRAHAGEYDKAANDFDEALGLVPEFPTLQIEYARAALQGGNLEHAKLLASEVIRKYPQNMKVAAAGHALLGRTLLKLDKDAAAKVEIEKAVALDPTFENGYELAVADLDLGDETSAAKIFAEMLA